MNIYLVERTKFAYHDEYTSFVASANSEDESRNLHPRFGDKASVTEMHYWDKYSWPDPPDTLKVTLLGTSNFDKPTIHCSSFNEG